MTGETRPVYRAPMRARTHPVGRFIGARTSVARSQVGIGEPLSRTPGNLAEAVRLTVDEHGDRSGTLLTRFAEVDESALVWTRTAENEFRLGRLTGPWRYDDSSEARADGIRHVRAVRWLPLLFDLGSTPPLVVFAFYRGGRNFQRIRDPEAESMTNEIWDQSVST